MPIVRPYIPTNITVHLGTPDSYAQNVVINFQDYIKNVASSEIYPTWNQNALYANIYAQISYALNRIYLEHYTSKGYNFDITSSTAYDQKFIFGRNIFENISKIVDEIFNDYIRRIGVIEPLAAKYCNGTTTTCNGLSQWGSEKLAKDGYSTIDILYNYYGYDIELVIDAPIQDIQNSYPGYPLRKGDAGKDVVTTQTRLNLISQNYPSIPKIYPVDGIFGTNTENAVKRFQSIFNLTVDGIVGKSTWYKSISLYTGIKKLAELNSEGVRIFATSLAYPDAISEGDKGEKVSILQFFINLIGEFYSNLPTVPISGVFGSETKIAVVEFQRNNQLPPTGVVDEKTWDVMYEQFKGITNEVMSTDKLNTVTIKAYPGTSLKFGDTGENVKLLQEYINLIYLSHPQIPPVTPTGKFGNNTKQSVIDFQTFKGLPRTGIVDKATWEAIGKTYKESLSAKNTLPRQYPGFELKVGDTDDKVKII